MNWLTLAYFLTAGLNLHQSAAIQDSYWAPPDNAIVTTLGAELLAMDHLFLAASVMTEETYFGGTSFAPVLGEYNVKVGLRFGGFEIGYMDDCTHPVLSSNIRGSALFFAQRTGFYVSFKGSIKLF